ncbi:unnamed protein product [Mytilus edulis]|uniref:Uncharacterized protein n=1 Tax=Mytilus edulis TaxID=6550 RepID=A0A8S3TW60_MYTED|nr:unnamed protein product [Mytilus edulis]
MKMNILPSTPLKNAHPRQKNAQPRLRRGHYMQSHRLNQGAPLGAKETDFRLQVQIGFRSSQRNSLLQGPGKLACRAIVMKQYKTALNHLLQIDEVKRDLATTVKKTLDEEAQKLCRLKSSVFKVSNISKFTWRSAISQLENTCPITMDILSTIIGNNKKEKSLKTPRMVTSMGVLLFSRNRRMNTLQAINSVMMYRGHVRTRVYSTFNRAGISNSYKATLGLVDQICENFDMPVKKWSKEMSNQYQLNTVTEDSSLGDHCYSTIDNNVTSGDHCYSAALLVTDTPLKDKESYGDLSSIDANEVTIPTTECFDEYYYATPITKVSDGELSSVHPVYSPLSVGEIQLSDTPLKDNRYLSVHGDVPVSTTKHFDDTFDVWVPNITEEQTTSPDLSPRTPVVKCVTDAAIVMSQDESPFTTTQMQANSDRGSFQVVKTLDNKNKIQNLVHSIAVHSRMSGLDLDSTHPQANILSIPNDAFIPGDQEYFNLHHDFKTLMKRTLIENVLCLEAFSGIPIFKGIRKKEQHCILEKDENIMEQMIEIMEHLQQYVPTTENGKMIPLLLGGDALSVERGDGAQRARQDARTPEQKLDGYESFNMLFKGSSSGERGTLFQLKNMLDRRGVKSEVI